MNPWFWLEFLLAGYVHHLTAAVVSAFVAYVMVAMQGPAVRAFSQRYVRDLVMGTTFVSA